MKKLLTILTICVSMLGQAQTDYLEPQSIMLEDYQSNLVQTKNLKITYGGTSFASNNRGIAPGLIIGGAVFITAGLLTQTNLVVGTSQNYIYDLSRYLAIGTGGILMGTGFIVITIR